MNVFTIGFTKKNAGAFFDLLRKSKVSTLIDVRLNNTSQLSGFAKRDDLKFFTKELCQAEYIHLPELAPTDELFKSLKKGDISWEGYEESFLNLMAQRNVEKHINQNTLNNACLLCSEHKPHLCHRKLVVDYLNDNTNLNLSVTHLF
ncbi:DUF488 family protein [Colwellia sp. RE-S-Sl-9]